MVFDGDATAADSGRRWSAMVGGQRRGAAVGRDGAEYSDGGFVTIS